MSDITLDTNQIKELVKSIILELLQEDRELFSEILAEVIEDIAMERVIAEVENTELVSRDNIFKLLEGKE